MSKEVLMMMLETEKQQIKGRIYSLKKLDNNIQHIKPTFDEIKLIDEILKLRDEENIVMRNIILHNY
jgi:hypothetical protein